MDSLELVYEDEVVTLYWDTDARYHLSFWHGLAIGEKLRSAAHACLSASRERTSRVWLADIAEFVVIDPEDQKWITREFYPLLARNGVRRVAYVLPIVEPTEVSLRRMNESYGATGCIDFFYCATRAEAIEALAGSQV